MTGLHINLRHNSWLANGDEEALIEQESRVRHVWCGRPWSPLGCRRGKTSAIVPLMGKDEEKCEIYPGLLPLPSQK